MMGTAAGAAASAAGASTGEEGAATGAATGEADLRLFFPFFRGGMVEGVGELRTHETRKKKKKRRGMREGEWSD